MMRILLIVFTTFFATQVSAQDDTSSLFFGGDAFHAGRSVVHQNGGVDDLFMAGETVLGLSDITGTAHFAGREIVMEGVVQGDVYAAGEEITFQTDILGDATLVGRAVSVGNIGGDLRVAGSELDLNGDVGGYALIAGEKVTFNARVSGDVSIAAEELVWGDTASISGQLTLYEDEPGSLEVPEALAPAERITRRELEEWEGPERPSVLGALASFLAGVVVVAGIAALVAALVPDRLAEMRRQILARPFHTLWLGFLTQSTVIGTGFLLAITVIGLLLAPAVLVLALAGGLAGYVVAAYAFGVGLRLAFGKPEPDSLGERALAAGIGALSAGVIGLIPFLGWIFVLALALTGIGAITLRVIRPRFFSDTL
ncbi:hypothetical protein [Tropicimonas sp. S265A]|uniref:hypothetical protein n=1 Tax=Tropicimonas sp. S265A TaxID=3415134 RepID=UPI003C79AC2C